jgi:hypothetical protein
MQTYFLHVNNHDGPVIDPLAPWDSDDNVATLGADKAVYQGDGCLTLYDIVPSMIDGLVERSA